MGIDVLLGLQWGDEGKGKIVDFLAKQYNIVARFQGGPNAGHTLEFDGIKHVLHQIPSGIFHASIANLIGNGVVLDPIVFQKEIDSLSKYGLNLKENLFISKKTQIIVPTHKLLDDAYEKAKGEKKIGSTLRGIGPAYQDKIGRNGLRVGDLISPNFKNRYEDLKERHLAILRQFQYNTENLQESENAFFEAIEKIKSFNLVDSEYWINEEIKKNKTILAEGAQGSLLDVDFGSYPYVTSSTTLTAGACTGLGIAPKNIGKVIGIFKAYCTRVGSGPFPTELNNDQGEWLRKKGNEFGATTGRPRRTGWLDIPALQYANMLNGVTEMYMMKADVLNELDEIKICTHYEINGIQTYQFPYETDASIVPIFKTLKGWKQSLEHCKTFDQLPFELKQYIEYIEEQTQIPITLISTGPDRTQTITK